MKFSANKNLLLTALQEASRVVPLRTTLPILGCTLFYKNDQNKLAIRTSDLEQTITINTDVDLIEDGFAALPTNKMIEIVAALPEEEITIVVNDVFETEINSSTGVYKIAGKNPEEYPEKPSIEKEATIAIQNDVLIDIINKTAYAASKDDLKPALCGIYLNIDKEKITAVATDGHRLVKYKQLTKSEIEASLIVPVKFFNILKNNLKEDEKTHLKLGENHIEAKQNNVVLVSRIIKESFPDFNSVIPETTKNIVKIGSLKLTDTLKRVAIFSNKTTKQATISFTNNELVVATEDQETKTFAKEHLSCEYGGSDIKTAYNAQYLKEVIQHLSAEEINIYLSGPLTAAVFKPNNQKTSNGEVLSLLMPLRIPTT